MKTQRVPAHLSAQPRVKRAPARKKAARKTNKTRPKPMLTKEMLSLENLMIERITKGVLAQLHTDADRIRTALQLRKAPPLSTEEKEHLVRVETARTNTAPLIDIDARTPIKSPVDEQNIRLWTYIMRMGKALGMNIAGEADVASLTRRVVDLAARARLP